MSRKLSTIILGLLCLLSAGTTGITLFAQQPKNKRLPQWDSFQTTKPVKKWQYCTLLEARIDRERVQVLVDSPGMGAACNNWLELAENLGNFEIPAENRKNAIKAATSYRQNALDLLGEMGWEIISVHTVEKDRTLWVLKREK